VLIPRSGVVTFRDKEGKRTKHEAGMVFFLLNGTREIVHGVDGLAIVKDGILERMKIPVEIMG
jgi:hypothetical protein